MKRWQAWIVMKSIIFILFVLLATNAYAQPKITFTFDDGSPGHWSIARPIMDEYSMGGTLYLTTNRIDTYERLTWEQVLSMQNNYNWEIGSHTIWHPILTEISISRAIRQIEESKTIIESHGLSCTSFTPPEGKFNDDILNEVKKRYSSFRTCVRGFNNSEQFDPYYLMAKTIRSYTTIFEIEAMVEEAIDNDQWLILVFHAVQDYDIATNEYAVTKRFFRQVVELCAGKRDLGLIDIVNISDHTPHGTETPPDDPPIPSDDNIYIDISNDIRLILLPDKSVQWENIE